MNNDMKRLEELLTKCYEGNCNLELEEMEFLSKYIIKYTNSDITRKEVVSGVLIKNNLEEYKEMVEYFKSEEYELLVGSTFFNEIDSVEELDRIVTELEEGKEIIKDDFGRELQIITFEEIEKNKNVYIVKEPTKLPRVVFGKELEEIFGLWYDDLTSFKIGKLKVWGKDCITEKDKYNITLKSDENIMEEVDMFGPVVITGIDLDNEYNNTRKLTGSEVSILLKEIYYFLNGCFLKGKNLNY